MHYLFINITIPVFFNTLVNGLVKAVLIPHFT